MSIKYRYVPYRAPLGAEGRHVGYRPVVVSHGTLRTAEFVEQLSLYGQMSRGDAAKAVAAFFETLEATLRRGYNVAIDGYGMYQLSAEFAPDCEPSEERRAESIRVKSVSFKADAAMRHRITTGGFVRTK